MTVAALILLAHNINRKITATSRNNNDSKCVHPLTSAAIYLSIKFHICMHFLADTKFSWAIVITCALLYGHHIIVYGS